MKERRNWPLYAVLTVFALVAIVPFLWVLMCSLMNTVEIYSGNLIPPNWRFSNYTEAWRRARLGLYFKNSLYITVLAPLLGIALDSLAGYAFAKLRIRRWNWLFFLFLLGIFVPGEANLLSTRLQVQAIGLQNNLNGVVLAMLGTGMAFGIFLMRNFFLDIPDSFGESAKMDGAGTFAIFWRVYLPLARSGLVALFIFKIIGAWNEFNLSLFILTDSDKWTIPLAVTSFRSMPGASNCGYIFAAAMICVFPILILYFIFQRSFMEGITAGGVKG